MITHEKTEVSKGFVLVTVNDVPLTTALTSNTPAFASTPPPLLLMNISEVVVAFVVFIVKVPPTNVSLPAVALVPCFMYNPLPTVFNFKFKRYKLHISNCRIQFVILQSKICAHQ